MVGAEPGAAGGTGAGGAAACARAKFARAKSNKTLTLSGEKGRPGLRIIRGFSSATPASARQPRAEARGLLPADILSARTLPKPHGSVNNSRCLCAFARFFVPRTSSWLDARGNVPIIRSAVEQSRQEPVPIPAVRRLSLY